MEYGEIGLDAKESHPQMGIVIRGFSLGVRSESFNALKGRQDNGSHTLFWPSVLDHVFDRLRFRIFR